MCVLAMAWRAHPDWQLVVIANRDERHARATAPLAAWPDSGVLAGRDLESGGTWLGVSRDGRFAALTNRSGLGEPSPTAPSRGLLVSDAITQPEPAEMSRSDLEAMNPFNMVVVGADAHLWANRPTMEKRKLAPGLHGLSNGGPDDRWDKIVALEQAVEAWMAAGRGDAESLLAKLREEPDDRATTQAWPRNAIFVRHPIYGTRCSTAVMVDAAGRGQIVERRYDANGVATGETRLTFQWPSWSGNAGMDEM